MGLDIEPVSRLLPEFYLQELETTSSVKMLHNKLQVMLFYLTHEESSPSTPAVKPWYLIPCLTRSDYSDILSHMKNSGDIYSYQALGIESESDFQEIVDWLLNLSDLYDLCHIRAEQLQLHLPL